MSESTPSRSLAARLLSRWWTPVAPAAAPAVTTSPTTDVSSWRVRLRLFDVAVCLALCLVAVRLVHLQGVQAETFSQKAQRQQISSEVIRARPGEITDRHGRLLATSITVPSLAINPRRLSDPDRIAAQLAAALRLDADELRQRLRDNSSKQFLWVKRRLSDEEAQRITELKLPREAAHFELEFERHYPQGELAAHVVGWRNVDGVGQGGAEEAFETLLAGTDGSRRCVRDARGYVLDTLEVVTHSPQPGARVMLTIDLVLQLRLEAQLDALMTEHRALGACAIVLDPRTGEVVAMGSRPTFNPAAPEQAAPEGWKNMALSAVFEPGSTFKPLVVAWGLDNGSLQAEESFFCHWGAYQMGRRTLHDHHAYGHLSVTDILVKSSNIGMAKIGERLGNPALHQLAQSFGFGQRTGIELPGEVSGILRPLDSWTSYSTGSIPMGQELAATPLQLLAAHAALANHGVRMTPHVLLRAEGGLSMHGGTGEKRVVSAAAADWTVREPMTAVIERGTGTKAKLPGVQAFGKTGTAQKMNADGTYSHERHFSSFLCGAPAENPRWLVLVSVDEPQGDDHYGGSVAAPYAAQILNDALRSEASSSDNQ